jgi:hypothetical protein
MRPRSIVVLLFLVVAVFAVVPSAQAAGTPNEFGVMDPTNSCPWPDELDPVLQAAGVQKCLPTSIKWTGGEGVRIVTDQLIGSGSATGSVTFWCETPNSLRFKVSASGLAPNSTYAVTASGLYQSFATGAISAVDLGTVALLHTNANGSGVVGGSVQLTSGGYELDIHVGSALHSDPADLQGIAVFK